MTPAQEASLPARLDGVQLLGVLQAALSAPSGDNCQPWRLVLREDGFDLRFVPDRAVSLLDVDDLASRMAAGALLETARLDAARRGWTMQVSPDPDATDPLLWARVSFGRGSPVDEDLWAAIPERHTNRCSYDGSPLLELERSALTRESGPTARVQLTEQSQQRAELAKLAGEAERVRAAIRRGHEDLHKLLRWTPATAEATRDGLDVRTLCLGVAERAALRLLAPWSRMAVAIQLGGTLPQGAYSRRLVESSSAVGIITVGAATPASATEAGRVMQRVWLRATRLGLAFSPMAALPLLLLHTARHAGQDLSASQERAIRALEPRLLGTFGLSGADTVLFMFRVGRAAPVPIRSLRIQIEDLLSQAPFEQESLPVSSR